MTPQEEFVLFRIEPLPLAVLPCVLLGVVTLALMLRIYVRAYILKAFSYDDWWLILSWCLYVLLCAWIIGTTVLELQSGVFLNLLVLIRYVILGEATYILNMIVIKFALAAFYLRIVFKRWHRHVIFWTVAIYTVIGLMTFFINLFQCGLPDPAKLLHPATCALQWNVIGPVNYVAACSNAVADWVLTVIPVVVIYHLQLPTRQKISASLLVALGAFTSIVSVVRIPLVPHLHNQGDAKVLHNIQIIVFLSVIEPFTAIVAMCASTYRAIWHRPGLTARSYGYDYGSRGAIPSGRRPTRDPSAAAGSDTENLVMVESVIGRPKDVPVGDIEKVVEVRVVADVESP